MKQKNIAAPLTEEVLKEELRNYPTKKDLENELKNHPTHLDIEKMFREQDEKSKQYRDDILNKIDNFMGKAEQLEEDNTFNKYDISNMKTTLEEHGKQITALKHE